jgi:CRISPR-associated protein Cmr4
MPTTANQDPYRVQPVVYRTLEPVHPGAGGYRLGRVDNTICREPGTNLPKIPGTSLAGAARAYAALAYGKRAAAGQHRNLPREHRENCPILYVFGTANDTEGGTAGKVSFGDAHILFFPVPTMFGPIWITTAPILSRFVIRNANVPEPASDEQIRPAKGRILGTNDKQINLGWLLFKDVNPFEPIADLTAQFPGVAPRLAIVHDSLFSQIVNSNLEVRTSVSIDPATGAAKDGALFTYEAIPRDTFLIQEIVEDNFGDGLPVVRHKFENPQALLTGWDSPLDIALIGLRMIDPLGIGGMGTRGFGRMSMVSPQQQASPKKESITHAQ